MRSTRQAQVTEEIQRISRLDKSALKVEFRELFERDAPKSFTKNIIARTIAYRIQERVFGGLDRQTEKLLDSYANGAPTDPSRYLKSGTVVVREYQGVRHTVTIADGIYIWKDKKFASLSTIAREITGTSWNGPRFFGLRESKEDEGLDIKTLSTSKRAVAR